MQGLCSEVLPCIRLRTVFPGLLTNLAPKSLHARSDTPSMDANQSLKFDRRRGGREPISGTAVAVFQRSGREPMLTSVRVADVGPGGLGVYSDLEIKPGTAFSLYPDDPMQPRRIGRVVRCQKLATSYRLGLQFQQSMAA